MVHLLTLDLHRGKAQFAQGLVRGRGGNAFVTIAVAADPVAERERGQLSGSSSRLVS